MSKRYLPFVLIPVVLLAVYLGWRTFLADGDSSWAPAVSKRR